MKKPPHIVCVNPWIHDFAAYDFWARPVGLLYLASLLKTRGCRVTWIDCLDRFHPKIKPAADPSARCGRGPYGKKIIQRPAALSDVPRRYSRYGIDPALIARDLDSAGRPDLILVTSLMTYWYPGVTETISTIREVHPQIPVVLGGVYASLCPEHAAKATGADEIITGHGEKAVFDLVEKYTGRHLDPGFGTDDIDTLPYPALDLQHKIAFIPILTSRGCPFSCDYCASRQIEPAFKQRSPVKAAEEIVFWHRSFGVRDVVFYDDALLVNPKQHADILFSTLAKTGVNFRLHTPNAMHIQNITLQTAKLMKKAGMQTLRLGLETTVFNHRSMDHKVNAGQFIRAAAYLKEAGFEQNQLGAYLLAGLPGQDPAEVEASIDTVKAAGITPIIAWYSPISGTKMWDAACAASRYDLASDPLFTNNAVMPCQQEFSWKLLTRFKNRIQR
jgi:radical SAM superfamily enzyme YgiQ (UPF0313 family)